MNFLKILLISSFLTLSNCVLGVSKLKQENNKNVFVNVKSEKKGFSTTVFENIDFNLEWVGDSKALETSKNALGLINRFVIPYTKDTTLIKVTIKNNSNKYLETLLSKNTLFIDDKQFKPYDLEHFKTKWPTYGLNNQDMLIDQSLAIGEIIKTIYKDKIIFPNSDFEGILAFPKINYDVNKVTLKTYISIENKSKELSFSFIRK